MGLVRVQQDKEVDHFKSSHESHEANSTLDFSSNNTIGCLGDGSILRRARQRNRGPKAKIYKMLLIPAFGACNLCPICLVDDDLTAVDSPRVGKLYRYLVFNSLLYNPGTSSRLGSMVS